MQREDSNSFSNRANCRNEFDETGTVPDSDPAARFVRRGRQDLSQAVIVVAVAGLPVAGYEIRIHKKPPIGFAEAEIKDEVYDADMTTRRSRAIETILLQGFGTGATSSQRGMHGRMQHFGLT